MITSNDLIQRHSDPSLSSSPYSIHFQNSRGHSLCERSSRLLSCWTALLRHVGTCLELPRSVAPLGRHRPGSSGTEEWCVCCRTICSQDHLTTTAPSEHVHHTSMVRDQITPLWHPWIKTPAGLRQGPLSLGVGPVWHLARTFCFTHSLHLLNRVVGHAM